MSRIVTATHVARFLSTRTSSRGGTKQPCLLLAWLTILKSSLSLLVILPHYLSDQKAMLQTTSVGGGGVVVLQRNSALVGGGIAHN